MRPAEGVRRATIHFSLPSPRRVFEMFDKAKQAKAWVASQEGRKAIQEILSRARETRAKLTNARRVDYQWLHRPMTI